MSTGRGGPQSFYNGQISSFKPYQPISRPAVPDPGFLAKVEEIRPNYNAQEPRTPGGFWVPPDRSDALDTRSEYLFRYRHGVFREVAQNDLVRGQLNNPYKVATVFSQAIDTDHLLTVSFDARTRNVFETDHDWQRLSFEYKHVQNVVGTLASLVCVGEMRDLPAPIPEAWEKLIPQPYRYQRTGSNGNPETSGTIFAGLIGDLPLLVALAAFSACPDQLRAALTTSRSAGKWVPHNYPTGRISERGLVITIYKDPGYTAGSTDAVLENLEKGTNTYGAFYAP